MIIISLLLVGFYLLYQENKEKWDEITKDIK